MAFVPGLSKSQVVKVIQNYANLAPATMQLLDDLSAQINDPNDPASALIARMTVVESDLNIVESAVSSLSGLVSGKQDAVPGISSAEIGTLDGIQSSIQGQLDSKAPLSSPTLSNPTFTGTVTLPNESISNNKLTNSSISINGTSVALGGNVSVIGTVLPSQTDNAGKALVTNGNTLSWGTVGGSGDLTNPELTISNYVPTRGIVKMVEGTENFLSLSVNSSTRQGSFTLTPPLQDYLNPSEYNYVNLIGNFAGNEVYYYPERDYDIAVPKAWLNGQLGFPPSGGWAEEDYVFVNYTNFTDGWDPSYTQYTYVINFTVPQGIDIVTQNTTSLYGEFGWYRYYGNIKVLSELKYLDGVTYNIQDQLNSGELLDRTLKISEEAIQLGESRTFSGNITLSLVPNKTGEGGYSNMRILNAEVDALDLYIWQRDTARLTTGTSNPDFTSGEYYTRITGTSLGDFDIPTEWWGGMGSNPIEFSFKGDLPWTYQEGLSGTVSLIKKAKTEISPSEIKTLDGITGNIESRLKFDSVLLDKDFRNDATLSLSQGSVYYSNYQPASNYAAAVNLYNDVTRNPGTDPLFSLNGGMEIGKAVTFVIIQNNTSTGIYFNEVNAEIFDGSSTTVNLMWQGGSAPTSPNLNSKDIYTFTVLKTANNQFDVFADVARFA